MEHSQTSPSADLGLELFSKSRDSPLEHLCDTWLGTKFRRVLATSMNSIRLCAALVLGALLVPVALPVLTPLDSVARADDAATPEQIQVLTDIYAKRNATIKDRDFDAYLAYETNDYVEIDAKGKKREKNDADAHFKDQVAQLPPVDSFKTTLDKVTVGKEGTTVAATTVIELSVPGQDGGDRKLVINNQSTDIWVKNEGAKADAPAMLIKQSTEIKTVITLDGQPFDAPQK